MHILLACLLTVVVETAFLAAAGLRKKEQIPVIICVNTVSNIVLNFILLLVPRSVFSYEYQAISALILLEATVVFSEFFVYRAAFGDLRRLFLKTFFANLLSFALGVVVFTLLVQNNILY